MRTIASTAVPATPASAASMLSDHDLYLFNEGSHFRMYDRLGAHPIRVEGKEGVLFGVWAPNAEHVSVIGDFNGWKPNVHALRPRGSSGIWETFVPDVPLGSVYKFHVRSRERGYRADKADPYGVRHEIPPRTGSVVWNLDHEWRDQDWMTKRAKKNALDAPLSIYEVHLGSWRLGADGRPLTYREIGPLLADHVAHLGFTHVELLPVMEHPFGGSWGYQTTGYFAPSSRFGTPQDFMWLIDHLHQRGIGVILDWVPSHFPSDEHGLAYFDGTHLYEHEDSRKGFHPDWKSFIFNYGRHEVRSFLLSSAMFWLDKYHIDGLRVDAVASMLYLDYSRKAGEWIPNEFGGRENLEAIAFLRRLNEEVYRNHPDVQTIAEESTAWPSVSRPTYVGGLGFGLKWDMGWMHDTLEYFAKDPIHRRFHHNALTFRMIYAFHENFVLPLSHDEVVHGKGSLIAKMPGDAWQKFANLRTLYAYMMAQPGKKLLFMGAEFAQGPEWDHDRGVRWEQLEIDPHRRMQSLLRDLLHLYRNEPALHQQDTDPRGFEWLDANDADNSVLSFLRHAKTDPHPILCVFNGTPIPRDNYTMGVPKPGFWRELFNSDATEYGGTGRGNLGGVRSTPVPAHGRSHSVRLSLPPLSFLFFKHEDGSR
jgi:1,4-alpha-glucan branching enzyme